MGGWGIDGELSMRTLLGGSLEEITVGFSNANTSE